jgi:hypothetical protein
MPLSSIVAFIAFILAIPLAIACWFSVIQSLRRARRGPGLDIQVIHDSPCDDRMVLELITEPGVRSARVERIILQRRFAARVLAQPPQGFRERHPAPPPSYDTFEPDLDQVINRRGVVDPRTIEAEKRRQHTDLVNSWADMCEAMVTWEGRLTVRRGCACRLVVPMRTDVAAMGRISVIYSYRVGLLRTMATTETVYRPRLVALHG